MDTCQRFSALPMCWAAVTPWDTPLAHGALLVGLAVLGSLLGSFANVVVYRLPRRESLLWPGSRCPACGHAIRWFDNVPVFGWLLLLGKCRDCKQRISPRYPLVEALFAALLAVLGNVEIGEGLANLPLRAMAAGRMASPNAWLELAYHFSLVATLVTAALIHFDGQRLPRRLLLCALGFGLALPLVWTNLRPVALAVELPDHLAVSHAWLGLVEGLAGLAAGTLLGMLFWPATGGAPRAQTAAILQLAVVGAFLGWQAVSAIAVLMLALALLPASIALFWPAIRRIGWSTCLAIVMFAWILDWAGALHVAPVCGGGSDPWLLVGCGAIVAIGSVLLWWLGSQRTTASAHSTV